MSSINKHLNEIWGMEEEKKEKCIHKLKKVCGNILQHPENPKFRDMNFTKVRKMFTGMGAGLHFLFSAGFVQSVDGTRLTFPINHWDDLQHAMNCLRLKENPPPPAPEPEPEPEPQTAVTTEATSAQAMDVDEANAPPAPNDAENAEDAEMAPVDGDGPVQDENAEPAMTEEEIQAQQAALQSLRDDGIDIDDDLMAQIRAAKGNTVRLQMSELVGKTKEEKLAILAEKREQFRKDKERNARRAEIDRERQRRENVKMAAEARRQEETRQLMQMAARKKREKAAEKERKKKIREKIRLDKERRQRERERAAQARQSSTDGGGAAAPQS